MVQRMAAPAGEEGRLDGFCNAAEAASRGFAIDPGSG